MKCPLCNNDISYIKFCPYCKKDMILSKKILSLSDVFYNKALMMSRENNLSDAIISLKKSLALFKANNKARNLLGLIYYRMGRLSDALKHWIISSSFEKEAKKNKKNNTDNHDSKEKSQSERYLFLVQQEPKELEKYNDAIKFYNLALTYINQNNDDMGVIQLKKSLELNPDFIDAANLLTLCYIYQDKKSEAKKIAEHVLEIDKSNPTAKKYFKIISDVKTDNSQKSKNIKKSFINLFDFSRMLVFLFGILFGIAFVYILVYPTQINSKNTTISQLEKDLDKTQEELKEIKQKYDEQIPKLKQENDALTKSNIEYQQKILQEEAQKSLDKAEELYKSKKVAEAADILYNLGDEKINSLSDQALTLKNKIYANATKIYYEKGLEYYRKKNYDKAKENFSKAATFAAGTSYKEKIDYYLEKINSAQAS